MQTHFQASLSFGRELERLKASFDPAWDKYESQGRLSAHRYLRGDELDTVFDQWNEGREDATEIECVIIVRQLRFNVMDKKPLLLTKPCTQLRRHSIVLMPIQL
jgi:hypothetical protein